jgi:hypothetical protein
LKIGANWVKSTEGTEIQSESTFQSVSTDFARLDRDFQSRARLQRSEETFGTFKTSSQALGSDRAIANFDDLMAGSGSDVKGWRTSVSVASVCSRSISYQFT